MFFRHRKTARAAHGPTLRPIAPDRAVRTAEAVLRRAWTLELARQRDSAEFTVRLERGNCEAAVTLLHRAQLDGDPAAVSAARESVLQALNSIRTAIATRDRIRRTQRKQLRLLARRPKRLSAAIRSDVLGSGLDRRRPRLWRRGVGAGTRDTSVEPRPTERRSALVDLRSRIRRRRKPLRLMRRRSKAMESE
jgi:hypothetical protein